MDEVLSELILSRKREAFYKIREMLLDQELRAAEYVTSRVKTRDVVNNGREEIMKEVWESMFLAEGLQKQYSEENK